MKSNERNLPIFLMGHSMGGAQVLQYAARGPVEVRRQLKGYVVEAPFVALHKDAQPARLTVVVGRLAAKVLPRWHMVQKVDPSAISRDPQVCKEHDEDELCHNTGTLEGLAGMLQRAEELDKGEVQVMDSDGTSLWIGHGTEDRVCSFEAVKNLVERMPVKDKTLRTYRGWFHKCK